MQVKKRRTAHPFDPFGIAQGLQQAQDKWRKVNGLKSILQAAESGMRKGEGGSRKAKVRHKKEE